MSGAPGPPHVAGHIYRHVPRSSRAARPDARRSTSAPTSASHIYADRKLFQRAVENLLRNATRHACRRVFVKLYLEDHSLIVSVHDDGPGIPKDQRERALMPFVRLESSPQGQSSGIGLGLSIVARVMKRHRGTIKLDRSDLGGLSVTLCWPESPQG